MKTVTVKGKVYQLRAPYFFYNSTRVTGEICFLLGVNEDGFHTYGGTWENCVVLDAEVGTITVAPIEIEDGDMCRFEYENTHCMGFYSKANKTFVNYGETICFLNEAIMIAPLMERT